MSRRSKEGLFRFYIPKFGIPTSKVSQLHTSGILDILTANRLERWYDFSRTDWSTGLEYIEWTTKEVSRFLEIGK